MRFPQINTRITNTVNVPELSGGINRRDAVYSINDNQLTDCKNMWFKKGALTTRPGYTVKALPGNELDKGCTVRIWDIYDSIDGEFCRLVSCSVADKTRLFYIGESGVKKELTAFKKKLTGFIVSKSKDIYIFNKGSIYKYSGDSWAGVTSEFYVYDEESEEWKATETSNADIYIPTVMTNCLPNGKLTSSSREELISYGAVMVDGYNLLTPYYRMIYSTVNKALITESNKTHPMIYTLPESVYGDKYIGYAVTAVITDKNGIEHTHKVIIDGEAATDETEAGDDDLKMRVVGKKVWFIMDGTTSANQVGENDFVRNNLIITAPFIDDSFFEKRNNIFSMTRAIWYGGYRGLNGGTRLFIGGSSAAESNNLIMRSGLNEPLYFPEDGDIRVGDSNQAVTGFAKQNENLIIFKEHEIYSTEYSYNSNIDVDSLESQSVYNFEAQSVYFPLIQIHAGIGCRLPDSIELCRNRLVWADTDGKVYSLVSGSQYNERNVYELSGMVKYDLKREELKSAHSCDYDGHYILFCGKKAYVMDYNSYGYTHCYSYSKTEDAQKQIPWYYWEFEDDNHCFTVGSRLAGIQGKNILLFSDDLRTDGGEPIPTMCETKCFDFGAPSIAKNILLLSAGISGNTQRNIKVKYITDIRSDDPDMIIAGNEPAKPFTPNAVKRVVLRPNKRFVDLFGVRFECDGSMTIGKITVNYKLTGVKNQNGI